MARGKWKSGKVTLSDLFIHPILEKIDSPQVIGVGIVGSYARGQEGKHREVVNKTLHLIKEAGYL